MIMYRFSSFIAHGTSCFYNIGSAQHRLHNMFQNERTSCLWLPLVASHLTRLQFKVMDFSVAIVVVFVLHTDSMIGNVRLPQLRLIARERSCPGPQKHSGKAILKGPWKVHGLAKPQWVSFCEVGMAYFTAWQESTGKGGSSLLYQCSPNSLCRTGFDGYLLY